MPLGEHRTEISSIHLHPEAVFQIFGTIFSVARDHVPLVSNLSFAQDEDELMADEVVECHSGYTYAERPIALRWEGERLAISEIQARWRIPGGIRFRVTVMDGRVFELFYGELYDEWRVSLA